MIRDLFDLEGKVKAFPSIIKPILFNADGNKDGCVVYYKEKFKYIIFERGKINKEIDFLNEMALIRYLNHELYFSYRFKVFWGSGHDNDFTYLDYYFSDDPRNNTVRFPFEQ